MGFLHFIRDDPRANCSSLWVRGQELVTINSFRCVVVILLSSCHFVPWVSPVTCSERRWHAAICVVLCCVWRRIPGRLNDRRTPLGELNWIFTAITDTIAWNVLPRGEHADTPSHSSFCLLQTLNTTHYLMKNSSPSFSLSLATWARIGWFIKLMWHSWSWIDWNTLKLNDKSLGASSELVFTQLVFFLQYLNTNMNNLPTARRDHAVPFVVCCLSTTKFPYLRS